MTTIAANREQIAGDRQATHTGGLKFQMVTKIQKFKQPALYPVDFYVGLAGNVDSFFNVFAFLHDPSTYKKAPTIKGGEGLVLSKDGKIWTFCNAGNWLEVTDKFYAIGSGMNFAMGSMKAGATPVEAVKYAATLDPHTGMGVTKFNI